LKTFWLNDAMLWPVGGRCLLKRRNASNGDESGKERRKKLKQELPGG
jgi:hypothetical protein